MSESMQVAILIASFGNTSTSPYGAVITALQTITDDELSWDRATARLLQEYSSQNESRNDGEVLTTADIPIEQKALKAKGHIQCYNCGKYGRYKRECQAQRRFQKGSKQVGDYNKRAFSYGDQQKQLFSHSEKLPGDSIVIDSGASCHMFSSRELFHSLRNTRPRTITVGGENKLFANKMGSVIVNFVSPNGKLSTIDLKRVPCVPQLDANLMSCAALDVEGYSTHFEHGACHISREKDVVAHGSLFSGLYVLNQYKNDLIVHVAR